MAFWLQYDSQLAALDNRAAMLAWRAEESLSMYSRIIIAIVAIVALSAVALASPALAAKGGNGKALGRANTNGTNGSEPSVVLDQTEPHLGDWVTFTSNGGTKITVACYQNGIVYTAEQPADSAFLLGGEDSLWWVNQGQADCYAWLYSTNLGDGFAASARFTAGGSR